MDASKLYAAVGDDLSRWQQLLGEIKDARQTIDSLDREKSFGPVVISFAQVQASVNNKYDFWQKDVVTQFGLRTGEAINRFYSALSAARGEVRIVLFFFT